MPLQISLKPVSYLRNRENQFSVKRFSFDDRSSASIVLGGVHVSNPAPSTSNGVFSSVVQPRHAELLWNQDALSVRALAKSGSPYSFLVNGTVVRSPSAHNLPYPLRPGDILELGMYAVGYTDMANPSPMSFMPFLFTVVEFQDLPTPPRPPSSSSPSFSFAACTSTAAASTTSVSTSPSDPIPTAPSVTAAPTPTFTPSPAVVPASLSHEDVLFSSSSSASISDGSLIDNLLSSSSTPRCSACRAVYTHRTPPSRPTTPTSSSSLVASSESSYLASADLSAPSSPFKTSSPLTPSGTASVALSASPSDVFRYGDFVAASLCSPDTSLAISTRPYTDNALSMQSHLWSPQQETTDCKVPIACGPSDEGLVRDTSIDIAMRRVGDALLQFTLARLQDSRSSSLNSGRLQHWAYPSPPRDFTIIHAADNSALDSSTSSSGPGAAWFSSSTQGAAAPAPSSQTRPACPRRCAILITRTLALSSIINTDALVCAAPRTMLCALCINIA
ncbi:hypothetical protein CF326_g6812 [Tilletia indica]|nr:hypothetical protein CF326_g6812 [Tilletia indica]